MQRSRKGAVYRLNPIVKEHAKFDVTEDYARSEVEDYQQEVEQENGEHAIVVYATFELEPAEMQPIRDDFGAAVFNSPHGDRLTGYDNVTRVGLT